MDFEGKKIFLQGRDDGYAKWAAPSTKFGKDDDSLERRTRFKHDEDEITYSRAFRRLSHKSQVVVRPESDHFRSRLTHTLEVNQIAESIANRLGLNISLVNAIALGHDIGHCPFGHAGEREIQAIIRSDLLSNKLCDPSKLGKLLNKAYGLGEPAFFDKIGNPINNHWLFHHAINSVRVIDRKMRDVTKETRDGIICHSWSPWQDPPKFGIPPSYEAQVVAMADQIAGMNHDTEDILSCEDSEHNLQHIRSELPAFFDNHGLSYRTGEQFCEWFLPADAEHKNGYSRKTRLQKIINSAVSCSLEILQEEEGALPQNASAPNKYLRLDSTIGITLKAYEEYVRAHVINSVSWFRHRDAVAQAVIRSTYNFYRHYGRQEDTHVKAPDDIKKEVIKRITKFRESIKESYADDNYYNAVIGSALAGNGDEVRHVIQCMDYVTGMTDKIIMDVHRLALALFE